MSHYHIQYGPEDFGAPRLRRFGEWYLPKLAATVITRLGKEREDGRSQDRLSIRVIENHAIDSDTERLKEASLIPIGKESAKELSKRKVGQDSEMEVDSQAELIDQCSYLTPDTS